MTSAAAIGYVGVVKSYPNHDQAPILNAKICEADLAAVGDTVIDIIFGLQV